MPLSPPYRPARPQDAPSLARLIDLAGEGIPSYLWGLNAEAGHSPLEVGAARAARDEGGFSYRNAVVHADDTGVHGLLLSYRLDDTGELGDLSGVPAAVVPLLELEAGAPGSWYVNAVAVDPDHQGRGIGRALMAIAEELGRNAGARELSLIVAEQNTRAVALYERLGYRVRVRRASVPFEGFAHSGDFVLMTRPLDA